MLSIFDQGPAAPCPSSFNLAAHVLSCASDQPQKIALSVLGHSSTDDWNYGRLQQAILGTGTGLLKAGLQPGDLVLMQNSSRLGHRAVFFDRHNTLFHDVTDAQRQQSFDCTVHLILASQINGQRLFGAYRNQ